MSAKGHQKKRNTGLLYEFLIATISKSLVENDKRKSSAALKILKRYFKPGTELYKEFRLINALVKTTVSSNNVAASIMSEAKAAVRALNVSNLDREKSLLIRSINHTLNDDMFYDQPVNEYKLYATIQTLFNDWRAPSPDLMRIAQFEDQLTKSLITEKVQHIEQEISSESNGTARLLLKVMTKKLNEKYKGKLNESQRAIIKAYAYSSANDDSSSIKLKMSEIKVELLEAMSAYDASADKNEYVSNKMNEAKKKLLTEDLSVIDDDTVTRFMLYAKLSDEMSQKDGE